MPVKRVTPGSYTVLKEFPEHLQGLGLIAAEWAGLENQMAITFGAILDNPEAGEAILLNARQLQGQGARDTRRHQAVRPERRR